MSLDNESIQLIDWLKSLPKNTTIEWTSDHYSIEHQHCGSWVDVRVPEVEKELGMNWFWTIVHPELDDLGPEAVWQFVVDFDLDIHSVYDPEPPNYWYINEIPLKKGKGLAPDQEAELETALYEGLNRTRVMESGWSSGAISKALEVWTSKYVKRLDIKFEWNPLLGVSKLIVGAEEALDRILSGEDKGIDLGDGVRAADGVMDFFLGMDIDEAAKLTQEIKNKLGNQ